MDSGAIDLLCQLTHKYDPSLRLNGVWGLMVRITKSSCTIDVPIEFHDIQEMDFQEAQEIQILQEVQENENIQQIIEVDLQVRDVPTSSGSSHLNPQSDHFAIFVGFVIFLGIFVIFFHLLSIFVIFATFVILVIICHFFDFFSRFLSSITFVVLKL